MVIPQLRRGENSLLLWNTSTRSTPVHTFVGHRDVVLEFEWRKQRPGETDFQLVTWSKDQTLLVWKIPLYLQKLCGHEPDLEDIRDENDLEMIDTNSRKSTKKASPKAHPLQQEFSLLNVHIPNLDVIKMDVEKRCCTVRVSTNSSFLLLQVTFPKSYPHGVPPTFQILDESAVEESVASQLLQTLTHIALQRVQKNRTCLESCLRQLATTLDQLNLDNDSGRLYDIPYMEPVNVLGSFSDVCIPFPRTSGAKFCSVSHLVCFGRPAHSRHLSGKMETSTPRALSALENSYGSKRSSDYMTVSSYYFHKQKSRSKHSYNKSNSNCVVHIYDAAGLFLMNKQLAEEYILNGDVATICKFNAGQAGLVGRSDLVQAWTLAELISSPQQADEDNMWSTHPFGNQLMQSL